MAVGPGCSALLPKPLPPRAPLEAVRFTRFTAADARFTLSLVLDNPNSFDLAVSSFDVRLLVEGEPLASGALAAPAVFAAQSPTRVEVEARAAPAALASVLERFSRQRSIRYDVTGSAVVQDGWELPFARSGEFSVASLLGLPR